MDKGGAPSTGGNNGRLRVEPSNNRAIYNDGTSDTILIGIRPDGLEGIFVAPHGLDVKTLAIGKMIMSSLAITLSIAVSSVVRVTRVGGSDSAYKDVPTNSLGATTFICTVRNPGGSPSFKHQTPFISSNSSGADAGKITANRRVLYDPTNGVMRFFVESTTIDPNYGTTETWEFQYLLLYQNIPS
jgi:hypothetical protein